MRWALLLACWSVLLGAPSGVSASGVPTIAPLGRVPLVVRGTGFRPAEKVLLHVEVRSGPDAAKTVVSGPRGGFTARFRSTRLGRCDMFSIRATGSRGSRAIFRSQFEACGAAP